jgi:hypothetical protein
MFLKLLNCHEEESDAKKRKLQRIANGSQEQNTRAENDQGQDGDHSANKGKAQTTVNQFYKKQEREEVCVQICRFFYTSAIAFNAVKNPEFVKMV